MVERKEEEGGAQAANMASTTDDAPVDAYCVDFCKSKLTVLGIDVDAVWKAKVRAYIYFGLSEHR